VDPSQSHRVSGDERRIKAEIISFLREGDNMRGDSKTTAQSALDAIVQETRQALRGNQSFIPGMTPWHSLARSPRQKDPAPRNRSWTGAVAGQTRSISF
jgi:hypothetical protein